MSNKKIDLRRLPRVEVEWLDIVECAGWTDLDDVMKVKPEPCRSIGYLLDVTGDVVRLISSNAGALGQSNYQVLPRGVVKSIHRLRRGEALKITHTDS